jgi:predicted metal-dependent peptidase
MAEKSDSQRLGIIVHECWHALWAHMSAPFVDDSVNFSEFARLRNQAMDYVVERAVFEAQSISAWVVESARDASYREETLRYADLSWVQIYQKLKTKNASAGSKLGGGFDEHFWEPASPQENQELQERIAAVQEAMQAIKSGSKAGLTRPEGEMCASGGTAAKKDWRDQFRSALTQRLEQEGKTWRSVDLRSLLCLGQLKPRRKTMQPALPDVRILLDTSGSMSQDIADAVADVAMILNQVNCLNAHVRYYGSGLLALKTEAVVQGALVEDFSLTRTVPSGGGTSVRAALQELAAEDEDFEGITICVTDGQDDLNVSDCAITPDFWIIYSDATPDCGHSVHI